MGMSRRREFLAAFLGAPFAARAAAKRRAAGRRRASSSAHRHRVGHRLRDGVIVVARAQWTSRDLVIVGARYFRPRGLVAL